MIVRLWGRRRGRPCDLRTVGDRPYKPQLGELASLVTGSLVDLVENGQLDAKIAPSLRIHLDWIQYKTNFRDPVTVRRTTDANGKPLALAELAIDLRQCNAAELPAQLERAVKQI